MASSVAAWGSQGGVFPVAASLMALWVVRPPCLHEEMFSSLGHGMCTPDVGLLTLGLSAGPMAAGHQVRGACINLLAPGARDSFHACCRATRRGSKDMQQLRRSDWDRANYLHVWGLCLCRSGCSDYTNWMKPFVLMARIAQPAAIWPLTIT